jgi:hypothetical protein
LEEIMLPGEQDLPVEDLSTVCCDGCGICDASLRYSEHPTVISSLVRADESARVGIWCARCRGIVAAKATAVSLLAGWWSVRGPMLTIAAIRANLRGGRQTASTNAQMLHALARREYDAMNLRTASMFARAAQAVKPQTETGRLIHELNRVGQRTFHPSSPWRFAPVVPVVAVAVVVGALALTAIVKDDEIASTPLQPAATSTVQASTASPSTRTLQPRQATAAVSADDLEKQLTPDSDAWLARQYFDARLREARAEIPLRVRRGDEIGSIETSIAALGSQPAVARLLERPSLKVPYANLLGVLSTATRYYRVGAPVETIERTANESLDVTLNIAIDAIGAEVRGHSERSDALGSEVQQRAAAIDEMRRELRIRGAVISQATRAIDECLKAR